MERRDSKNRILLKGEYQNSNGRYMYKYKDSDGEDRFVYSWTLTQTDRVPQGKKSGKCLRELEKEIAKDLQDKINHYKANSLSLNSLFDKYIEQKRELKPSTRRNYKYMYDNYVRNSIGKRKVTDIKYSDVKKYYCELLDSGFKPNTLDTINTIIHPVFTMALRDGYIRFNPSDGIMSEIKKSGNWEIPKRHALTVEEQKAFVEFLSKDESRKQWYTIVGFLLGTGCRIGEAIGLRWEDCDFKNNLITINHNLVYYPDEYTGKAGYHITTPKTQSGIRVIPMFPEVRTILLREKERQLKEGSNISEIDGYKNFVFCNRFNMVCEPRTINKGIQRAIRDYNLKEEVNAANENREPLYIPHISVHNLRHTFCTRMCENETNIKVIQEIMGHADITTTMDIYNEATLEKKVECFTNLQGKFKIS